MGDDDPLWQANQQHEADLQVALDGLVQQAENQLQNIWNPQLLENQQAAPAPPGEGLQVMPNNFPVFVDIADDEDFLLDLDASMEEDEHHQDFEALIQHNLPHSLLLGSYSRRLLLGGLGTPPSLLRVAMAKLLTIPNLSYLDSIWRNDLPVTLFYDVLWEALCCRQPRSIVVQQLLKYWPDQTLRLSNIKPSTDDKKKRNQLPYKYARIVIDEFFRGIGGVDADERKNLRSLDLRALGERYQERIVEFKNYFSDPYFKHRKDYFVILPVKIRHVPFDYNMIDWPKLFISSPNFFKVSSITMDCRKENMDVMVHLTNEYMDSAHFGKYSMFNETESNEPPQLETWLTRIGKFNRLTSLTISSMSVLLPVKKVLDKSDCLPNVFVIQQWNTVLKNLNRLESLSITFQCLKGELPRLLKSVPFALSSFSLEGCVLDKEDLEFLEVFCQKQKETISKIHLGIYNFKQFAENIVAVLAHMTNVKCLLLQMGGRLDSSSNRHITRDRVRGISEQVRTKLKANLRMWHLPEFDLETPGLVVEIIDKLMPGCSKLRTLIFPTRVTRTVTNGQEIPFMGDLRRLGPDHKYKPFVDAFTKHLSEEDKKTFSASATFEGIRLSTSTKYDHPMNPCRVAYLL